MIEVPQWSTLGPVPFLDYVNDLVKDLEPETSLFAYDAKIYRTARTESDIDARRRNTRD